MFDEIDRFIKAWRQQQQNRIPRVYALMLSLTAVFLIYVVFTSAYAR